MQELNDIRTNELKAIIEADQKLKGELMTELDIARVQCENFLK